MRDPAARSDTTSALPSPWVKAKAVPPVAVGGTPRSMQQAEAALTLPPRAHGPPQEAAFEAGRQLAAQLAGACAALDQLRQLAAALAEGAGARQAQAEALAASVAPNLGKAAGYRERRQQLEAQLGERGVCPEVRGGARRLPALQLRAAEHTRLPASVVSPHSSQTHKAAWAAVQGQPAAYTCPGQPSPAACFNSGSASAWHEAEARWSAPLHHAAGQACAAAGGGAAPRGGCCRAGAGGAPAGAVWRPAGRRGGGGGRHPGQAGGAGAAAAAPAGAPGWHAVMAAGAGDGMPERKGKEGRKEAENSWERRSGHPARPPPNASLSEAMRPKLQMPFPGRLRCRFIILPAVNNSSIAEWQLGAGSRAAERAAGSRRRQDGRAPLLRRGGSGA